MDEPPENNAEYDNLLTALGGLLSLDATDITSTLTLASTLLSDTLGAEKIDIFLYDAANETLVVMGTSATQMSRHQKAIGMDRLALAGDGREVEVFQTGASYRTEHADQDPAMLVGMTQGLGIKAQLAVPVYVATERRGVLVAASSLPAHFSVQDLRFLEAVAAGVGNILHRAELVTQLGEEAGERGRHLAVNEILTVMAHELRSNLKPLQSHLNFLQQRAMREHRSRDMGIITEAQGALVRLRTMIANLLDVEKIEQGIIVLDLQPVDVVRIVQEISVSFQTPSQPIHVAAPEELIVTADPKRLRQALENVLVSAMQHSPQRTPIEVTVAQVEHAEQTWANITVQDYGPSIPTDQLPHLFERFEIGVDATRLGLGLYLASRIVVAHAGLLTVDDTVTTGVRLQIRLPMHSASNIPNDVALPYANGNALQRDVRIRDLTDEQWEIIERMLPPRNQRGRPIGDQRRTINGILYVLGTGCAWDKLPARYGSYVTCWRWYIRWQSSGTWQRIQQVLTNPPTER